MRKSLRNMLQQQNSEFQIKYIDMAYYQKNMLSIKSRALLANILAETVLLSSSLEIYREALANIDYFDCIALFRYLDREEKGYLREKDFQRAIGTSHRKLLSYAFSWLDNMKVGEVSRLQFAAFLLPKDDLQLRELVARRVQSPQLAYSQHETLVVQFQIFSKMLVEIMNREMQIIELRRELMKSKDYSMRGVLAAVDGHNHRWVCGEDLYHFLKNYGFDVNLRQVEKLVEVVNCNLDGKITEEQLRWTVEGFEAKDRAYLRKIKDSNRKEHKKPSSLEKDYYNNTGPVVREFTENEQQKSQLNETYKKLTQIYRISEQQEKTLDELLKKEEAELNAQIDIERQKFLVDLRERRALQISQELEFERELKRKVELEKEKELYLAERERQFILREQEKKRKEIEREMHDQELVKAYLQTKSTGNHLERSRPESHYGIANTFYSANSPAKSKSPTKQELNHSPLRRDYTNLTHLSRLTQVESYRKATQRSNYTPYAAPDYSSYLEEANQLREIIKKQREIERQIQSKISTANFNASKYNSKGSDIYQTNKSKQIQKSAEPKSKESEAKHDRTASPFPASPAFKNSNNTTFLGSTIHKVESKQ